MCVCCRYSSDATPSPGADCRFACMQDSVKYGLCVRVCDGVGICLPTAPAGGEGQKINKATSHVAQMSCKFNTHTHKPTYKHTHTKRKV